MGDLALCLAEVEKAAALEQQAHHLVSTFLDAGTDSLAESVFRKPEEKRKAVEEQRKYEVILRDMLKRIGKEGQKRATPVQDPQASQELTEELLRNHNKSSNGRQLTRE